MTAVTLLQEAEIESCENDQLWVISIGMNWIDGTVPGDGGGGNVRVAPWSALANFMSYSLLHRGVRTMPGINSRLPAQDKNPQINSSIIRMGIG
jgi:hypothetical protein